MCMCVMSKSSDKNQALEMQKQDCNSYNEEDFIAQRSDDAYVEDELPDLVLDTTLRKESTSSLEAITNEGSNSSSIIDLLMSLSNGRRSVSDEGISHWIDATDEELGEEVHAERTMNDDFKVTYTNHSKAYVPKLSGTDVYRSYLNLLPEDEEKDEVDESKKSQISEERKKILAHFKSLSGQEQESQRKIWSQELSQIEKEIAELRNQLGVKESRRNHLRHLLGIDLMAKVKTEAKKSVSRLTKEFKDFLNTSSNASENNNSTAKD